MAGRLSLTEMDLSCSICCEIFRDPVVLKCSHSFCAPCLQRYWTQGPRQRDCPLCRSQSVDEPVPSLTLKNLCEAFIQEGEGPEDPAGELYCDPGDMCPLHGERLKLYCVPDQEPICVVCHTSRKHKLHDCCPVGEAVADVKVNNNVCYIISGLQINALLFTFSGEDEVRPRLKAGEEGRF